jgi:UDP-N-acetylmuramoyl-tripeptide--D-alanyl-D-alanine ligase
LPGGAAYFFDDPADAGDFAGTLAEPGDAVLFKGSRGVKVEKAMARLLERTAAAAPKN